ncbi:hypothetical protein KEJ51_08565, partial [Candidatus Bathyarchaeota archaeon]|nr:hypothetical protein [Candidatus Bathyarchaeota archaeon]
MRKRVIAFALIILSLTYVAGIYAYPYQTTDPKITSALNWLKNQQQAGGMIGSFAYSSWAVMAIASAEQDPNTWEKGGVSVVQYLKNNVNQLSSCTDYSRFILSMVAARIDPETITKDGQGLVTKLKSFYDGSQFGDGGLVNDDFWAVMALISAGVYKDDPMIQKSLTFIKSKQNSDGGWSWAVGQTSDVDDTAAAIMALIAGGEPKTSTPITNGLSYMKSQQLNSGGFGFMGSSSAETDSWAIQAIVAAGQDPTSNDWTKNGKTPVDDLLTFQDSGGGFKDYTGNPNVYTTSCAIPALLGKPYPIVIGAKVDIRIEGQSSTVWKGVVFVSWSDITDDQGQHHYYSKPTVLGALDEASRIAGFTYVVTYQYGPAYVTTIKGEAAQGLNGWLFRVNEHTTGMYAADQFVLNDPTVTTPPPPHSTILWFYGGWNDNVTRISVDRTTVKPEEAFTVTVTYLDETTETWLPVQGANVHADKNYVTDQNGQVSISISTPGTYGVYAEKEGFVRTDRIQVTVTGGDSANLQVNIIPALSIVVTPDFIDFGTMGPGDISQTFQIHLVNNGSLTGIITVNVTDIGNSRVFRD